MNVLDLINRRSQKEHKGSASSSQPLLELSLTDNKQKTRDLFRVQCGMCTQQEFHLQTESYYVHVEIRPLKKEVCGMQDSPQNGSAADDLEEHY